MFACPRVERRQRGGANLDVGAGPRVSVRGLAGNRAARRVVQMGVATVEAGADVDHVAVVVGGYPVEVAAVVITEFLDTHVSARLLASQDSSGHNRDDAATAARCSRKSLSMILIDAPAYVPFQPRTDAQRALRAELRRNLKSLKVGPGEILWASFAGPLPPGADVENALFYNLDGGRAFADSMDNGVSFELDPSPLQTGVRYRYEIAPADGEFRSWRAGRGLAALVAELHMPPTLASVWWALRSGPGSIRPAGDSRQPDEPFAVMLDVEGPERRLTPVLVKTILDGVVCGLQSQTDTASAAALAPRVAGPLDAPVAAVADALTRAGPSAIGVRTRLVHARGNGVQWTPDDDRCVAARLLFRPAERWRIAGTVTVAVAR